MRLCEIAPSTTGCGSAASPYATGYGYNVAGEVTGFKYGNGIYASLGFTPDRLQLSCLDYSTTNRNGNCAHDATTKFGLNYSYGSAGSNNDQISGITDYVQPGRSATFTYDSLYRLTNAVTTGSTAYPAWGLSESYDRYGNRFAQTVTAGTAPSNSISVSTTTNQVTVTSPSFCTTACERVYSTTSVRRGGANGGSQGAEGDRRAAIRGANATGTGGL